MRIQHYTEESTTISIIIFNIQNDSQSTISTILILSMLSSNFKSILILSIST